MDGWIDDGWMDEPWVGDGWMDGWMIMGGLDGCHGGWMDGCTMDWIR